MVGEKLHIIRRSKTKNVNCQYHVTAIRIYQELPALSLLMPHEKT